VRVRLAASILALALGIQPAVAQPAVAQPADGYIRRLQALALLETLNGELLSHDSATAVLQAWCDAHGPGGVRILADRVKGVDQPPPPEAVAALGLKPGQAVRFRHVRLTCGDKVLSEADNWYLPERLTPQMNGTLDGTDTPFGVVVRPLDFRRRNLGAQLLYRPLEPGWEARAPTAPPAGPAPAQVLRHTAILTTPDGAPLSFVAETYTGAAIDMAMPRAVPGR
jgi:hypothetical protein